MSEQSSNCIFSRFSAADCAPEGRVHFRNAADLRRRLFRLLWKGPRALAVDLSRVQRMDGAGVAVLVEFLAACRSEGARLRLLSPSMAAESAFGLYGLGTLLESVVWRHPGGAFEEASDTEGLLVILEDEFEEELAIEELPAPRVIVEEDFEEPIRLDEAFRRAA